MRRAVLPVLLVALLLALAVEARAAEPPVRETGTGLVRFNGKGAEAWHWELVLAQREIDRLSQKHGDAEYAYRIASAAYGVPVGELRAVGGCESSHTPSAQNPTSSAGGLMQYLASTWAGTVFGRAGFSRFDPVPAALAAARHVATWRAKWKSRTGGWSGPWLASKHCHGLR